MFRNKKTVGIRVPDNNIIRDLVKGLGNPILSTSVKDDSGVEQEYFTDPELMEERMKNIADVVVNGGYGELTPSTVVDCTGDDPVIVRQGKGELVY